MSKKFRLLMVLVLVTGMLGGLMTASTVSADPTPGTIVEIPRIDVGTDWDTRIQIQNVSGASTTVTVEFWPAWSQTCPPQADTSLGTRQMVVPANGVWTLHNAIPATAQSAIVTTDPSAEVAVTVDRWGLSPIDGYQISSSYTGVADPDMVGSDFEYFAPYIMHGYHDLDTVLTIQNSGDACTSIWIYYKQQGNCECMKAQHIEQIRPGEAVRIGPGFGADVPFPPADECSPGNMDWVGSAFITANEELGIVVDQLSLTGADRGTLLTMRGLPYDQQEERVWYADLLYREISGWDASIQVQNLTRHSMPTFVTVDFMDQSGDEILFVGDWICRNGARTFYLPAITDLGVNFPFGYVGAAEIASHQQVDYPGEHHDEGEPIFAVVDLKKSKVYDESLPGWRHTVAGETQGGAYNAHPEHQKENATGWAMPHIAKEQAGVTSRIALRNNSNCNKFYGKIWIVDETGTQVGVIHTPWLHPKHLKIIDLAYQGFLPRGFLGAAYFEVLGVEQLCDTDADGITDQLPVMPSIVVLNYGFEAELPIGSGSGPLTDLGDLTRVYEAIPYVTEPRTCEGSLFGDVTVRQEGSGFDRPEINGVLVSVDDLSDETDSTGGYQIKNVEEGEEKTVTATKTGFFDGEDTATVECGKETQLDFELVCAVSLYATVEDTADNRIPGATVTAVATYEYNADDEEDYTTEGETDNAGVAEFDVAGADTLEVTASADGHDDGACTETRVPATGDPGICYGSWTAGCELCKWATAVGTIMINDEPAAGYTVKALNMTTLEFVDEDVTTADGVFSVENLSVADGPTYRLYLYNTSGTLISTTGDITLADPANCGDTLMCTYDDGEWGDDCAPD